MDTTALSAAMHPSSHEIVVPPHLRSELLIITQLPNDSFEYYPYLDPSDWVEGCPELDSTHSDSGSA